MGIGRLDGNSAPGKVQRRRIGATPPSNIKNISEAKPSNGQPHALSAFRRAFTNSSAPRTTPYLEHPGLRVPARRPCRSERRGGGGVGHARRRKWKLRAARRRRRLRAVDFFRSAFWPKPLIFFAAKEGLEPPTHGRWWSRRSSLLCCPAPLDGSSDGPRLAGLPD